MNSKILIVCVILLAAVVFITAGNIVKAASVALSGFAWSSNIGWIQFNPVFGGVYIDDISGDFSGYAWSDNIGWISFQSNDVLLCPSGTCTANVDLISGGDATGWAKALSTTGGWDGFISLNCINSGMGSCASMSDYKVSYNASTGELSGFAWGSDVVGWVSFNGTAYGVTTNPPPTPECSDSADNDGDTYIDYPDDPGCTSLSDTTESPNPQCSDGADNDGDLLVDLADICGCTSIYDDDETNVAIFNLSADPSAIYATTSASPTENSSETTITVSPTCFSDTVSLSSDAGSVIIGATDSFSPVSLDSSEYSTGSQFYVTIPNGTSLGTYSITITGTSASFTDQIVIQLNIDSLDPDFEEF